jgi:hypothetical protein
MGTARWILRAVALIYVIGFLKRTPGVLAGVALIALIWAIAWVFRRYVRPGNRS